MCLDVNVNTQADMHAHAATAGVLLLPGLPVAEPVAAALSAPLDAFVVRKIGAPLQPE